ncbi:FtsH protease activity modulator HflK [Candidatus Erwinia haradaeae]|uniref:Protein HflK n=1 Tax=Candidatus Erwinia haradaeae TaxID=1922217 RepID=A0A451DA20_9GAMM|nr:FtsH protease activity modulator HflK [Candidatus Erwinia haradaeae]VFP83195.1 Modulator of FtsH protease HflK [Candidatus Erwinia haradaeae]
MAWNHPGDNGQDNNPWGGSHHKGGNSTGNKEEYDSQTPYWDDFLRKLSHNIIGLGGNKNAGNRKEPPIIGTVERLIGIIVMVLVSVWVMVGFYTIKEAERGVITRFGKFSHIVYPGLNWKPVFIDHVQAVNVEAVRELSASGTMLTADENVVRVEMNVQYRVTNPERYLFSVNNADDSLRQATDSALRGVVGRLTMDRILTEGRTVVRSKTQSELEETISLYDMGITLLDVNLQAARPPEDVKAAFDDAIAARENREQVVREAEAYANDKLPRARGDAQGILEKARAYKTRVTLEAQGEVNSFSRILPEYKAAPQITRERLYIETMEHVLGHTRKVLVNNQSNNLLVLPLDHALSTQNNKENNTSQCNSNKSQTIPSAEDANNYNRQIINHNSIKKFHSNDIADARRANSQRTNAFSKRGE